jgi:hypothetical protein
MKINLTMQYCTFMLDDESAQYVIIVTPFGKWHCMHVPMGFIGRTNWVQAVMEEIFQDIIQDIKCYNDDIGIFDTDWDNHIKMIDLVLAHLKEHDFTIIPLKCEWAIFKTDWLGHDLMPDRPKPWRQTTQAYPQFSTPREPYATLILH